MGRSQLLYDRTAARMRAGRGRGAGRHDAAADADGRRGGQRLRQQQHQPPPQPLPPDEEENDNMMAVDAEGESNDHEQLMRRMQKAAKDGERKKDQEAEQLLLLSQATSQWASAQQVPIASGEQRHSFLGAQQEPSLSETEALCSRMGKALELGLSLSERLRLPPHLVETVYGPDRRKKENGARSIKSVPESSNVIISNPKQSNDNGNEQDDAVDALLSVPSSNNDETTENGNAVDALLLPTKETGVVDDSTKTLIEGLRSELGSSSFPTSEAASYEGYDEDEDATRKVATSFKSTTMTPRGPPQQHHGVHSPPTSPSSSHHPKGASSPAHYMEPTVSSVLKVSSPKPSNHKHVTNDGTNHNTNHATAAYSGDDGTIEQWLDDVLATSAEEGDG